MKLKKKLSKTALDIEAVALEKPKEKKKTKVRTDNILSSGSTMLNLACTNNPFGAFTKGDYVYLVGDTSSGKTFLSMTCLAETLRHPEFKNYRLIYDNVENGMNIDLETLFNKEVAERVEPPKRDKKGNPEHSMLIEEFYYNLDDAIKAEKPFIYILDSMDGLDSEAEGNKFEEEKKAHENGKTVSGSYGTQKAKKNSENLRRAINKLGDSILIIISQTRDNLGFGFEKKSRSGGKALAFYAHLEVWSSVRGKIKKTVKGKPRTIGVHINLQVKKNRTTGELHKTEMDIYPQYGIDDIGSMIDYLVEEKWWVKKGSKINAVEFALLFSRDRLISHIEEKGLYKKLQIITGRCWKEIREACNLGRKRRY
jgi:RecA/RadA recombinase